MIRHLGPDFRVLDVRRGGMGDVFIVQDLRSLAKGIYLRLALKTFQDRYLQDAEARARFEREALRWVALGKHPHIVHAIVVQEIEGKPYIWLEFVDGESLADRLRHGPLPVAEAIDIARQFCAGMRHAHEIHGLVHRDIKPANIMITRDGIVKITDFGLAKLQHDAPTAIPASRPPRSLSADTPTMFSTEPGHIAGTPAYIAPEQILDPAAVDGRADVYAFGLVLFELVTGRRAFDGDDVMYQRLRSDPPRLRSIREEVPAALETAVARCVIRDRERRCQSFAELEASLVDLAPHYAHRTTAPPAISASVAAALTAQNLMGLRRWPEAVAAWKAAIELDATVAESHNNLAVCAARCGLIADAAAAASQAVSLRPSYVEAWANLGGFLAALGDHSSGLDACDRAIALDPTWAEAHAHRGLNLAEMGRFAEADDSFDRALTVDPRYALAYVMKAQAAAQRGVSARDLVGLVDQALEIERNNASALAFKAACLADLGRQKEAAQQLALAAQADPLDPMYRQVRAAFERARMPIPKMLS